MVHKGQLASPNTPHSTIIIDDAVVLIHPVEHISIANEEAAMYVGTPDGSFVSRRATGLRADSDHGEVGVVFGVPSESGVIPVELGPDLHLYHLCL